MTTTVLNGTWGIVGYGTMAQAMVRTLLQQGVLETTALQACVRDAGRAAALTQRDGFPVGVDPAPVLAADHLLLAIKPQQWSGFRETCSVLPERRQGGGLLISILAGVPLGQLVNAFPQRACVRAVPNLACRIGQGVTGLSFAAGLSPSLGGLCKALFAALGRVETLPESQMDAFLALAGSGPAMVAVAIEALADGGVAAGLSRKQATANAIQMVLGSAAILQQEHLSPAELKEAVCSPGGTSIAAVAQLERSGLRSALIDGVLAAQQRSAELARTPR